MPTPPRQKACLACAESKRRCDKLLPECERCLERDVDCIYPQPKRRRRNPGARDDQIEELARLQDYVDADALGTGLDPEDWTAMGATDLDVSLSDVVIPYIPLLPAFISNLPLQDDTGLENGIISTAPCPWFLQDETWAMQYCTDQPACVTFVSLEPFIYAVKEMLSCWVENGHNSFIHHRLYEKGMPTCLQDAFTTLAAYAATSPAVKETILQIADERASALIRQDPPPATGAPGILAHLARVQALFIYEFIRLFDGSIRLRASAELQLPTLRAWVLQMWSAAKSYHGTDILQPLSWLSTPFDNEYETSSQLWHLWILTESVRRSHLIIDTIANIYQTMTRAWVDCSGAVMFTARTGLWDAESVGKWAELVSRESPLLVPSLHPGPLMERYKAEEVDGFARMYWGFLVGEDKMRWWVEKGEKVGGI